MRSIHSHRLRAGLRLDEFTREMPTREEGRGHSGIAFGECGEGFIRCSYAYSIDSINEALNRGRSFCKAQIIRKPQNPVQNARDFSVILIPRW